MELYYFMASPPCRAVLLFMHALSLKPDIKVVDISKGEQLSPDYIKLNPQHTIPVIVDNGFVLSESRAILGYLAEQYGQNTTFYPNNAKTRGVINQRLMFDIGTLYQRFLDAYMVPLKTGKKSVDPNDLEKIGEAFGYLETFMGDAKWMAGDEKTIADYSLAATVSTIQACGYDISKYGKITAWLDRCKQNMADYADIVDVGSKALGDMMKQMLGIH